MLFIDLDRFKSINDALGHAAGDEALRQTALRLRGCVRETDIVARLGGDEFIIILSQIRSARDPESIAAHVTQSIATPFLLGGAEHALSASVGIAIYPADGACADELLRNADTAMYRAKEGGAGRYVYFEERMNVAALARLSIERELQRAVDRSEFSLAYQPQLDLRSGQISGAEALLRWELPGREQRLPAEFMQIAEETGLIEPIGDWMLGEACRQFRAWQDAGIGVPRLAVNVSARQLRQKGFVEKVREIMASTGAPPYCIELEIGESLLIDANGSVARALDALKSLGVTFCLDEFGTGHSSLTCLNRYPIENVKIDRSFVPAIGTDNGTDAMIAAIVSMAHALSKRVVADGVESEKHAALLGRLGCDQIQGHYVGRPLDAATFAEFVKESAASAAKRPTFLTRSAARA